MTEQATKDTAELLKECEVGVKMALYAFEQVIDETKDDGLRKLLNDSRRDHERLEKDVLEKLRKYREEEPEPPAMGRISSWVSTEVKLMLDDSNQKIAKIISEGCHMGINSLSHYMNEYRDASGDCYDLCTQLIKMEQALMDDLRVYL